MKKIFQSFQHYFVIFEQNIAKMSIGSKVKHYRERKNYSQEDLASLLNVAQTTISSIESDKSIPNALLLKRISEELEVDINELLDGGKSVINNVKENNGSIGDYNTVYIISEKLIEQYEGRINELKEQIELLKKTRS